MPRLSLSLLGPFQVTLDGNPVTAFESDKVRALLAYLAVESDRPQRRGKLAGLLWPERTERSARQNLSQALFNLRHIVGDRDAEPPFLFITPQTLQFNRSSDHRLDVATFEALLAACEAHPHRRLEACGPCADRLRQAVALYRGAFLEGFSLGDSPAFEEWVLLEQERLHRLTLDALCRLADRHERRGEYERTLEYAWRQVASDPWREEAHRQVMRALALSGRRNEALAQYKTCRRALKEEVGVQPEEETTTLYERIRDGEGLQPLSTVPPHNLPASLTPFIGRKAELAKIQDRLQDRDCRLLTLVGPGGIGKTRLALEAARAQVSDFEQGVFFVSLAALQSVEAIVPTVAEALGFSFSEVGDPDRQLLDYLRQKEILLVLDNFEHLLAPPLSPPPAGGRKGGASLVTDVLKATPGITILVTSRVRLSVRGEHLFPIMGMDVPEPLPETAAEAIQYGAVKLFLSCAHRAQPDLELMDDQLTDVVRICQLVQGIPLGITLAAAWVGVLSPAEIATQIGQSLDILEADLRDVPERQRSIRAVFDHSWNLLAERERRVFRALSIFRGGFTRQAAQAIAGVSLQELRRLVNQSLPYRASTGRYEVHELLRQYAMERLDAAGETDAAGDAHSAYYAAGLQQWDTELKGPRQQEALAEMDVEIENARAAWKWAVGRGQVARLSRAIDGLCHFYEWHARYQEGETSCRMAANRLVPADGLAEAAPAERQRLLARVLMWQGVFNYLLGHTKLAGQLLQQSLAILEELELDGQDTRSERAHVLLQMGEATVDFNREQAKQLYEQSLSLYRAVGDRWGTANALDLLGLVKRRLGFYGSQTRQLFEESLTLRKSLGDRRGMASSLNKLANLAGYQGPLEESAHLYREAISMYREIGDESSAVDAQGDLVIVLLGLGEFSEAHSLAEENLALCKDLGSKGGIAYAFCMLSLAELHHGEYEQARAHAEECIVLAREAGYQWGVGFSLWHLGCADLATEAYVKDRQLLQESVAVFRALEQRDDLAWPLSVLGISALRLNQPLLAEQCLSEALQITVKIGGIFSLMHTLPAAALFAADRSNAERAVELYALASRFPYVAGSRWFEDVFGRRIAGGAGTLPPDVVAAAQARGRARDSGATAAELLEEFEGRQR